ncbi:MAG: Dabb family protein, partial [Bacteroidota bacterium]
GMRDLSKCPTIHKWHYGKPAGTPRDVVDNTYDYAWIVHFKNAADQDVYQDEPIHHLFVERYADLWERVQVYDTSLM